MTDAQLQAFRSWFAKHVRSFRESDPSHQRNLDLKEEHTHRVGEAMERITAGLGLSAEARRIAATVALFHDLGRFPQYRRYRTFRDVDSVNHAKLALLELHRHRVLHTLASAERCLIGRAIVLHNRRDLPAALDPDTLLHSRLIRDADKLDILKVMAEHFRLPEEQRNAVVTLGLGPKPGVRDVVFNRFFAGRIMAYKDLVSKDELKVLLLSWVFDINFLPTLEILREQEHVRSIAAGLPNIQRSREMVDYFYAYIDRRLAEVA